MAELSDDDLRAAMPTVCRELAIRLPASWLHAVAERAFGGTPADRQQFLYAAAHMTTPEEREIATEAMAEGLRCRVKPARVRAGENAAALDTTPAPSPHPPAQVIQLAEQRERLCG